jgi:hypothetical protein
VTGLATDALLTLQQADGLISMDDSEHLPLKIKMRALVTIVRHAIREIDGAS